MKRISTALMLSASLIATSAFAQTPQDVPKAAAEAEESGAIIVTGSRIKQDPNNSALPLTIITPEDLSRNSVSNPEQFISLISTNGNGADNLASNTDVTSGAQRGTNGLSAANLRGQGPAATLVLLNGRRVAAHGLTGSAVDVNQIPFAAIERIEVLKDGASAIYGTDAIAGVINFITKKNFKGVSVTGFTDITQRGDSPIYRLSGTVGYGDLDEQGFNIMAAVSKSWNSVLRGEDRKFVSGNQPNRGLSVDTRGTPIATIFNIGANANQTPNGTLLTGMTLLAPGTAVNTAANGINILNLPGGAGCQSMDGGMAYDAALWANPGAVYACAWDTGRAAILQQPLQTLTYYGRATAKIGGSEIYAEVTGSDADSAKRFSNNQLSANATTLPWAYPLNSLTAATYNDVYDRLAALIPALGPVGNRSTLVGRYGRPIAGRWRCMACGPREYRTNTKTLRGAIGIEGPLPWEKWDYRVGASMAKSESASVLGSGYFYRGVVTSAAMAAAAGLPGVAASIGMNDPRAPTAPGASGPGIIGLINSGILNPFSLTQSDAALAGLKAISADGVTLYGGQYKVTQFDASISGPLFALPGGDVQLAAGIDYRRETYSFNGSPAAAANVPDIFNAAFDNVNALTPKRRSVKAAYVELNVPIFDMLEITGAARIDDYTGFGSTFNPKVSVKFRPADWLMFRGSYSTGFRVPAFNQIFNGVTQSPNPGNTLVDPSTCPTGAVSALPGCAAITPDTLSGGNLNLGPETSKNLNFGVVFKPSGHFSATADWWSIAVDDTIGSLTIPQLLANMSFFPDRVIRTGGVITLLDLRADNIGSKRTKGIDVTINGNLDAFGGTLAASLDGTYLLHKKEKFLPSAPYGPSLIGVFTFAGDLGLKWKHIANINWSNDDWGISLSQIFRNGYANQKLPGIANGTVVRPDFNERVKSYVTYNFSLTTKMWEHLKLTLGVKNIFDKDPPFAITYDSNTGAGSSWEPRVADPRGRSFTMAVEVKF